eukprot:988527-Pleurochrysis_carterae.AAC.2
MLGAAAPAATSANSSSVAAAASAVMGAGATAQRQRQQSSADTRTGAGARLAFSAESRHVRPQSCTSAAKPTLAVHRLIARKPHKRRRKHTPTVFIRKGGRFGARACLLALVRLDAMKNARGIS